MVKRQQHKVRARREEFDESLRQEPRPVDNLRKYKKKQISKNKVILQLNSCNSCFYSYLELQDDFIFRNLFLFKARET